jgi:predicted nucleotidyltransferase
MARTKNALTPSEVHSLIQKYGREVELVFSKVEIRLFGSYFEKRATQDSDIDVAVISCDFLGIDTYVAMKILNRLRRKVPEAVLIEAIPLTPEEFKNPDVGSIAFEIAQKSELVFKADF